MGGHISAQAAGMFVLFGDDPFAQLQGMLVTIAIAYVALFIFSVIVGWKIFEKAGQPGWASIIPIYNNYVLMVEVLKMPIIWFILLFVPCVNFVVLIILAVLIPLKMAEKFGKEVGFAIGLIFLGIIFYPILAFGDAEYQDGPKKKRKFRDEDEDEGDDDER
jgi:hypothetical protein